MVVGMLVSLIRVSGMARVNGMVVMVRLTVGNLSKVHLTVRVCRLLTVVVILVALNLVGVRVKVFLKKMVRFTVVSLRLTNTLGLGALNLRMVVCIKVNLFMVNLMVKVSVVTLVVISLVVILLMVNRKAMVFLIVLTVTPMLVVLRKISLVVRAVMKMLTVTLGLASLRKVCLVVKVSRLVLTVVTMLVSPMIGVLLGWVVRILSTVALMPVALMLMFTLVAVSRRRLTVWRLVVCGLMVSVRVMLTVSHRLIFPSLVRRFRVVRLTKCRLMRLF